MTAALLIGVLVLGIAGVALLVHGVRGRRIDDHPLCAACRFDLAGLHPGLGTCPECGATLTTHSVRIGNRVRSSTQVQLGMLALAPAVCVAVLGVGLIAAGSSLDAVKPVWWLILEARVGSAAAADRALTELSRRVDSGDLATKQIESLTSAALAMQEDAGHAWHAGWGDLVEQARRLNLLGPGEYDRFLRQSVPATVVVRPRVRVGDPVPIELVVPRTRAGTTTGGQVLASLMETRFDGQLALSPPSTVAANNRPSLHMIEVANAASRPDPRPPMVDLRPHRLAPGRHKVATRWRLRAANETALSGFSDMWSLMMGEKPPDGVVEWWVEGEAELEVVGEDVEIIEVIRDEGQARRVRGALSAVALRGHRMPGVLAAMSGNVITPQMSMASCPDDGAWQVVLRSGSQEWPVGQFLARRGHAGVFVPSTQAVARFGGEAMDVVLRPDARLARRTTFLTRMIDTEIVSPGVRIDWR